MQLLDHISAGDLCQVKEGVLDSITVGDSRSICTHMLWASFRVQDIIAVYIDLNFVDHPTSTVTSEYVKFLVTNSGFDKVDKISAEMVDLKVENKELRIELKKAQTKADTASSKFVDMKGSMDLLLKRMAKVESKV
jgi:hypothetical protein